MRATRRPRVSAGSPVKHLSRHGQRGWSANGGQGAEEVRGWRSACAGHGTDEFSNRRSGSPGGQGAEEDAPRFWRKLVSIVQHTQPACRRGSRLGPVPWVPTDSALSTAQGSCTFGPSPSPATPPKHQPSREPFQGRAVSGLSLGLGGWGKGAARAVGAQFAPQT